MFPTLNALRHPGGPSRAHYGSGESAPGSDNRRSSSAISSSRSSAPGGSRHGAASKVDDRLIALSATRELSAELLGQRDDDALWATDVAKAIAVLVLLQLANEFGAVGLQTGKDVLDVPQRRT